MSQHPFGNLVVFGTVIKTHDSGSKVKNTYLYVNVQSGPAEAEDTQKWTYLHGTSKRKI